ncbi:MAG: SAM-dependent methyltransferase [Bacteroidaceae bacterium]|nr:SAM-dependent methyltransferase [Bacteroidaceae bacterium]
MTQSVEPQIADLANGWLKQYNLKYYIEQDAPNEEIKNALHEYESKQGGSGGNRPDCNLLLSDNRGVNWPILIEYKGYKDKLVKLDSGGQVANKNSKGLPDHKNISKFAVNGAVHYANALLHYTMYEDIISIGMTGYIDSATKELHYELGVYYVGKNNLGIGQCVGKYTDLSFLSPQHFDSFIEQVRNLSLSPDELDRIKRYREQEINASLVKLNNEIFQGEKGLSEENRIYLVAATIIATIGIPHKLPPMEKKDLQSLQVLGERDGDRIIRKIKAFLADEEKKIPQDKQDLIINKLSPTLTTTNINIAENGESQLRRVFNKIYDDLGIYYKIGVSTDFTGRLFNEMYNWLGYSQDKFNDVVLTPSYVATLLARLARVDRNSYVWDFATGSAGLLVAAMNEMIADAKQNIHSPEELDIKIASIKANQLLGLEILENIYMLAIINMILMGDGRSNILREDSLKGYEGNYLYSYPEKAFPATAFVLNPPYSAAGNGMCFTEKALSKMNHGYAAIIIQSSAGNGKAKEYNKRILKHSTLLASIKMPLDLFAGRSSVQTHIYVFRVGEAHRKGDIVKFIDFSYDGYKRGNRKKTTKASVNLKDDGTARMRYEEIVNIVHGNGTPKLHYLSSQNYYEGQINPTNGADWNQSAPFETLPSLNDLRQTVADYLAWKVADLIKNKSKEEDSLGKH